MLWSIARAIVRSPDAVSRCLRTRRGARGYLALSHGLIAVGSGDARAARKFAAEARRIAPGEPLTLLLGAQSAQLAGDRAGGRGTFKQMAGRDDTKLLGLHGLFIEAQRRGDPAAARLCRRGGGEAGRRRRPGPGRRCWNSAAPPPTGPARSAARAQHEERADRQGRLQRQRAVLLTAQALAAEEGDRDRARAALALEAVQARARLGAGGGARRPPARRGRRAAQGRAHHRGRVEGQSASRSRRRLCASAPGDSARDRLARVEMLAGKAHRPRRGRVRGGARRARRAEFSVARAALEPLLDAPTRRVATLMAELETEDGDEGRAREWMARAVHARRDPAWTADGFVSDHWLPVSPVTGRLDAFEWRDPLAGVDHTGATIDAEQRALLDAPRAPPAPPLAAPASDSTDAVAPSPARPEAFAPAPAASKSDGGFPGSARAEAFTSASDHADVDAESGRAEPSSPRGNSDEPRPPPVIALAQVPDDPGPEFEPPPEEPAVEPGSVAPPDGWSRFRARFRS